MVTNHGQVNKTKASMACLEWQVSGWVAEAEPRTCRMVLACDDHDDVKWHKYFCSWSLTVTAKALFW